MKKLCYNKRKLLLDRYQHRYLFVTVQAVDSNTHYAFMFQEDDSTI